jgi:hypothetical protein
MYPIEFYEEGSMRFKDRRGYIHGDVVSGSKDEPLHSVIMTIRST